jgi:protein-disulfide isomerase
MDTKNLSLDEPEDEVQTEELLEDESEDAVQAEELLEDEPSDTLTFKRTHVYAALLPLTFVVGLAVGYIFWGREAVTMPAAPAPQAAAGDETAPGQAEQPQEVRRYQVPEDDDPVFGPDDAPITIIEFSDYECPYCQRWHVQVWPRLLEAYPDQIRLVYRDFPLTNIHPNATPAAAAANCAFEQDKYWEYNERLFSGRFEFNKNSYQEIATEIGLEMDPFNECLESGRHNEEVMADFEFAANLGVSSTPTFFVNGIPVVGAQPFEVFSQLIDSELAGEIP